MAIDIPKKIGHVIEVEKPEWQRVCRRGEEIFIENCRRRAVVEVRVGSRRFVAKKIRRLLMVEVRADGDTSQKELSRRFFTPANVTDRLTILNALDLRKESVELGSKGQPIELGVRREIVPDRIDEVRKAAQEGIEQVKKWGAISYEDTARLIHEEGYDGEI